jgi:hypothetical protein
MCCLGVCLSAVTVYLLAAQVGRRRCTRGYHRDMLVNNMVFTWECGYSLVKVTTLLLLLERTDLQHHVQPMHPKSACSCAQPSHRSTFNTKGAITAPLVRHHHIHMDAHPNPSPAHNTIRYKMSYAGTAAFLCLHTSESAASYIAPNHRLTSSYRSHIPLPPGNHRNHAPNDRAATMGWFG